MINKEQQTFKALFTDNGTNFRANLSGGTGNSAEAYLRGLLDGYAQGLAESVLEKGEAEGSIQQEGAKAIGPGAIALGDGAVAGCKGYYYNGINFEDKFLYISNQQSEPYIVQTASGLYDASFVTEWQVEDKFSIVNGAHYDEVGTITRIEGNRIYFDTVGFDTIQKGDEGLDAYSITVPSKPLCGEVAFGEGAFSASVDGKATGRYSVNFAREGRAFGDFSTTFGRNTEAAYASLAGGWLARILAKYSIGVGRDIISTNNNNATFGWNLRNPYENALICGANNDDTIPDLLLGVGYGYDWGDGGKPKNAFNVDMHGNVWVDKDPTMPMGVATKQYVDNKTWAASKITSGYFTISQGGTGARNAKDARANLMAAEIIGRQVYSFNAPENIKLKPNRYYVITKGNDIASIPFINITLGEDAPNTSILEEYKFRLNGYLSINFYDYKQDLPITVKGLPENFEQGKTYEISIIDGFAKYIAWE